MGSSNVYPGGGGDYTTLQAWEDAEDGTALSVKTARVDNSGDAGPINITGWSNTPTAANNVIIINDTAADQHSLSKSTGAKSARITTDVSNRNMLIQEPYVTVDGLYLDNSSFSATQPQIELRDPNCTIKNCFLYHAADSVLGAIDTTAGSTSPAFVENNVIWLANGATSVTSSVGDTVDGFTLKNNIFYCDGTATTQRGVYNASASTWTCYSNYVFGEFTDNWGDTGGSSVLSGDYNAQDDTDADMPGANSLDSIVAADQFRNLAGGDFLLRFGSDLEDAGDASNSTATDFDGTSRSTPDIGPDEYEKIGTDFLAANWTGGYDPEEWTPTSSHTDFTLLRDVSKLSATFKSTVQSDGGDIRVTKDDGTTELAFDLINWAYNAGAPTGFIRVKWSGASGTSAITARIWAGYSGTAVAYDFRNEFGSDNAYDPYWLAYYPDGGGTGKDRTSHGLDLTVSGSPSLVAGKFGNATDYDANTKYAESTSPLFEDLPETHDFSVICWIKASRVSANDAAWAFRGTDLLIYYANNSGVGSGGSLVSWTQVGGSQISENGADNSGTWHQQTYVSRASNDHEAFRDAASVGTATDTGTAGPFTGLRLGQYASTQWISGDMGDFHVQSVARAGDWLTDEFAQANDQDTFWTSGGWTATGGSGSILLHTLLAS